MRSNFSNLPEVIKDLQGKLIVSCQALPDEPLHSSFIMGRMALAASQGGAAGIRCNTQEDIIAPTMKEIKELREVDVDIICLDATDRLRPEGKTLDDFFAEIKKAYPEQLLMADCSTYEEGVKAAELGFDLVSTTLVGYTPYTKGHPLPALDVVEKLAKTIDVPVIAEGGIHSPEELSKAFEAGAFAAVVGGAITRPLQITERFVAALPENSDR